MRSVGFSPRYATSIQFNLMTMIISKSILILCCLLCFSLSSCQNHEKILADNKLLLEQGNYTAVIKQLNEVLATDDKLADGFNLRGVAHLNTGNAEKALADFNKAIKIDSENYKYFYNRGNVYQQTQQWADALQDYDKALTLNENIADLHTNRGAVLAMMNRKKEALAALNKALSLNPADNKALFNRGQVHANLENWDKAIDDLHHCVGANPDFGKAHLALALAEIKQATGKATEESCEHLKKAVALQVKEAEIAYQNYCQAK